MIQLSSQDRLAFYKRAAMSIGVFAFFLSVAANMFFLATRNVPREPDRGIFNPRYQEESLFVGPLAYGQVQRGFAPRTQKTSGTKTLLPVGSYVLPEGLMPQLTSALPLFRDQGVPLDEEQVQRIFSRLGVTMSWQNLQLLPTVEKWRTADRTMELMLDIEKRALTITRTGSYSPSDEGRAGDDAAIAIARDFASTLGIDPSVYGTPTIIERSTEPGGALKTYVLWPMIFKGVPLLDTDAQPVPAVQVQVGRLSRKALSMTLTLLHPDRMAISAYPRASNDAIVASLKEGGLLPFAKDLTGKKTDVVYTSLTPSYVLLVGDRDYPTYIIPTLLADFTQGNVRGRTFIPALSADKFLWRPMVKQITLPSSASGALKTGTGSL